MTQQYSDPAALERMAQGRCPECGAGVDDHSGWGGPNCSLTDMGVAQRLHEYRLEQLEAIIGDARVRFWTCPVLHPKDPPRVLVKWDGDLATCTQCGRTNKDVVDPVTDDELDDLVELWHDGEGLQEMDEFLAEHLNWEVTDVHRWIENARYRPKVKDNDPEAK